MSESPTTASVDAAPIFIVGAPRSGTSLLRTLLNRHPRIGLCDETYYFYYVHERRNAFGSLADPAARRRLTDRYLATRRVRRLGIPLDGLDAALMRDGTSYPAFFLTLLRFYAACQHKQRYGEKTPQHAYAVATLSQWYPHCRIIHLVRDPRDVVASLMRMPWSSHNALINAQLWCAHVAAVEGDHRGRRDNIQRVRYEQLVNDPHMELQRICAFLGEEYCTGMTDATDTPPPDAWWFARAAQPVTTERQGAWQEQLRPVDVAVIESVAAPLMRRLGYTPQTIGVGQSLRVRAAAGAGLERVHDKLRQVPRMWYYWLHPTELAAEERWIERHLHAPPDPTLAR